MTIDEIRQAVVAAAPYAQHYYSEDKGDSYTTWHQYQAIPLMGDGQIAEDAWRFQVDHFTRREDDPTPAEIRRVLGAFDGITVSYRVLPPEPETGYIHHVFQCEGACL
jgi:hypothetical protein